MTDKESSKWSPLVRRDIFQNHDTDGEIVTEGESFIRHGVRWIAKLWVQDSYRGKGLGNALLQALIREYQQDDLYRNVLAYNGQPIPDENLIKWYGKFGFVPTDFPGALRRPAGPYITSNSSAEATEVAEVAQQEISKVINQFFPQQ